MVSVKQEKTVNYKVKLDNIDDIVRLPECENKNDVEDEDRIAKFFIGKTILITGGTGFLGKVLFEKLLRSCSGVKKIYLLIRKKKDKSPQERLQEILNNPLFDLLKDQRGNEAILKQIEVVYGDIILPGLGLSPEDRREISKEVEIIYHSAATVRFDEPLHYAVYVNTRGTKFMLDLAKECKKLIIFTYISTAYCHCMEEILYEKPYNPPANPEEIIKICEKFDEDTISSFEKKILGNYPNTYSYTKALAEDLVVKTFDELPTIILRPSIIIPIWKSPIPGWTDNINGPTGILIGGGRGIIRTSYINADNFSDFIPVDVAANAIILSTWYTQCIDMMRMRIGNITSTNEIQITWNEILNIGRSIVENKIPFNMIAWYPGGSPTKCRFWHNLRVILFHWIPAVLGDTLLRLFGYPPVLLHVQNRVLKGFDMVEYYLNREWRFDNTETFKGRAFRNEREKDIYVVEKRDLDIAAYLENCIYATRRYILKTPDDMIPAAKRQMKIMWALDKFCKTVFLLWLAYFIYKQFLLRLLS